MTNTQNQRSQCLGSFVLTQNRCMQMYGTNRGFDNTQNSQGVRAQEGRNFQTLPRKVEHLTTDTFSPE